MQCNDNFVGLSEGWFSASKALVSPDPNKLLGALWQIIGFLGTFWREEAAVLLESRSNSTRDKRVSLQNMNMHAVDLCHSALNVPQPNMMLWKCRTSVQGNLYFYS